MTAVTADQTGFGIGKAAGDHAERATFPIKTAVTLYMNTLVNLNTSGRLVDGVAAASQAFAGKVVAFPDGSPTGNAGGTVRATVEWGRMMLVNLKTGIRTNSKIGTDVHVLDNVTVAGATSAGTAGVRIRCGILVSFEATTKATGWVDLKRHAPSAATG